LFGPQIRQEGICHGVVKKNTLSFILDFQVLSVLFAVRLFRLKLQMYDIGNSTGQIQEDTLRHELKTQNRKCTVKAVATFISCDKWNISISKILEVEPLRVHVSVLTLSRY